MEITKNKITEIFCIIDDFCQEYDKEIARMSICEPDGRKHRNRKWTMSRSEIWHSKKNDCRLSRTQVINFKERIVNVKLKDISTWATGHLPKNWVTERTKTLRKVS